ncbi:GTPase HflX [bacterium]|nr:GTPase HflX [bacterium]
MARDPVERTPAVETAAIVLPVTQGVVHAHERLSESQGLVEALGVKLAFAERLNVREPNAARFFGGGQVDHIAQRAAAEGVSLLVVDGALTPIQQRNLETSLQLKVVDRTGLILEIFGLRARTAEGRLQVEMARSLYERSRLVRTWTHLERQRGGFGFLGGPGETQLEADRRMLDKRLAGFRRELEEVKRTRRLQREDRARRQTPVVALVGYTNSGKSTLFNRLTDAGVLAVDMPFATLDPTSRMVATSQGRTISLIDTVGFISDLPTPLVAAFRATLEEVLEADLLLHVRDISHVDTEDQSADVYEVLSQIEGEEKGGDLPPVLEVWNKIDRLSDAHRDSVLSRAEGGVRDVVAVSALTGEGVGALLSAIEDAVYPPRTLTRVEMPSPSGRARAWLHEHCDVLMEEQPTDDRLRMMVRMSAAEREALTQIDEAVTISPA